MGLIAMLPAVEAREGRAACWTRVVDQANAFCGAARDRAGNAMGQAPGRFHFHDASGSRLAGRLKMRLGRKACMAVDFRHIHTGGLEVSSQCLFKDLRERLRA